MPKSQTKRIRVALGIDEYGNWNAEGFGRESDDVIPGLDTAWHRRAVMDGLEGNSRVVWIEADVPLPSRSKPTIRATEAGEIEP